MSKKLLNESTIRRFGALANLNPNTTDSFLQELEDEEIVDSEEIVVEPEEEEVVDVIGVEDLEAEEEAVEADVDGLVKDLVDHIATWAQSHGVSMAVEGGEEEEVVDDLELGDEELGDEELGDDLELPGDEEMAGEEVETEETFDLEEVIRKSLSEMAPLAAPIAAGVAGAVANKALGKRDDKKENLDDEEYTAKKEKPGDDKRKGAGKRGAEGTLAKTPGHGKVDYVNEKLVQEVSRRVKQRLAAIYGSKSK